MIRIYSTFGRDCNTLEDFKHDFEKGRDFKFYNGMYFSKRDRKLMLQQGMVVLCLKGKHCVDLRTMKYFDYRENPIDRLI